MNLLLDLKNISVSNVFFMDTQPNMLFDGMFTKINYCDEFFTMYGIYISVSKQDINALIKLESDILSIYAKSKPLGSKMTTKLADFLQTKGDKINSLKISGIWEMRNNEFGLTFKGYSTV